MSITTHPRIAVPSHEKPTNRFVEDIGTLTEDVINKDNRNRKNPLFSPAKKTKRASRPGNTLIKEMAKLSIGPNKVVKRAEDAPAFCNRANVYTVKNLSLLRVLHKLCEKDIKYSAMAAFWSSYFAGNSKDFLAKMERDIAKLQYNAPAHFAGLALNSLRNYKLGVRSEHYPTMVSRLDAVRKLNSAKKTLQQKAVAQALFSVEVEHSIPDPMIAMVEKVNAFMDGLSGIAAMTPSVSKCARAFALMIAQLWRAPHVVDKILAILGFLNHFDLTWVPSLDVTLVARTLANVIRRLQGGNGIQAQGKNEGREDGEFCENIFKATCGMFATMFNVKTRGEITIEKDRSQRLINLWRSVDSLNKLIGFLGDVFAMVRDKVFEWMTGQPVMVTKITQIAPGYDVWMTRICEIYEDEGLQKVQKEEALAYEVKALFRTSNELLKTLRECKAPLNMMNLFMTVYGHGKELYIAASNLNLNDAPRLPPLVAHFYGNTSLGKSTLVQFVTASLAEHAGLSQSSDHLYVRKIANEFWDNYHGQFCTVYDDIFQSRESEDRKAEALEMIEAANTMPFPLHMADLSSKGCTRFTSKVVLMTSNAAKTPHIGLDCPEAFWRRRDLVFEVLPNPIYCHSPNNTMMVDPIKVKRLTGSRYHWNVYLFQRRDRLTENKIGEPIEYDEMIQLMKDTYDVVTGDGSELIECVNKIWKTPVAQAQFFRAPVDWFVKGPLLSATTWYCGMTGQPVQEFCDCVEDKLVWTCIELRRARNMFMDFMFSWVDRIGSFIADHPVAMSMLGVAGVLLSCFMGYQFYQSLCGTAESGNLSGDQRTKRTQPKYRLLGESNLSGDQITRKHKPITKLLGESDEGQEKMYVANFTVPDSALAESCEDPSALALAHNLFAHNVCRVRLFDPVSNYSFGTSGMFVFGNVLMLPSHLFCSFNANCMVEVDCSVGPFNFPFEGCEVFVDRVKDLYFLKCPRSVPAMPSLIKHFAWGDDIKKYSMHAGTLVEAISSTSSVPFYVMTSVENIVREGRINYDLHGRDGEEEVTYPVTILKSLKYKAATKSGSCGSPLVVFNPQFSGKIIGVHVAGLPHERTGYSTIVFREYIESVVPKFSQDIQVVPIVADRSVPDAQGVLEMPPKNFLLCGAFDKSYGVHQPAKTEIIKSPLHGVLTKPVTAPAVLGMVKGISPLTKATAKYFGPPVMVHPIILQDIVDDLINEYGCRRATTHRLLTNDEAINGIVGNRFIRPINMDTSPGFPFVKFKKKPGKRDSFDGVVGSYTMTSSLQEKFDFRERQALLGIVSPTIWIDNLKDERREIHKIKSLSTRVFVTGPVDYTLLFRKYVMGFTSHMMEYHNELECAVGVNPHGMEWQEIVRRLQSVDVECKYMAGDFKSFDGNLPADIIYAVCDVVNAWYDDEFDIVRQVLFQSLASAYHLCGCTLYRVNHGNPSGNPFTAVVNSISNSILMRYAFLVLGNDYGFGLTQYHTHVKAVNYGDDNLLSVSSQIPWFNMISVAQVLEKIGVIYQPASKVGELQEYVDFTEVTFLKRGFIYSLDVNGYLAPLARSSIDEMINWIRKGPDNIDSLCANVEAALTEMFHHGPKEFHIFKTELDKALRRIEVRPSSNSYYTYLCSWFTKTLGTDVILSPVSKECRMRVYSCQLENPGD